MKEISQDIRTHNARRQRRNTILLVAGLAAVFLVLLFFWRKGRKEEPGLKAVIERNGEAVHTMDLGQDAVYRAEDAGGHYNLISVQDGCVSVTEADCGNQVCVKTGQIRYPGEVIACLPHRLIIYIE